jgi:hypothetical protein
MGVNLPRRPWLRQAALTDRTNVNAPSTRYRGFSLLALTE